MIRFKVFIVSLALAVGGLFGVAAPANAVADYATDWVCISYRDIVTCVSADWSKQADGTGVRLEKMQGITNQGCGSLEDGGRYNPVEAIWVDHDTGRLDYSYNFGVEPCTWTKDVSNAAEDTGSADLRFSIHARINNAADKWLYIGLVLGPRGGWYVDYKIVSDV